MKCQKCDQPATYHVTDILDGKSAEHHLCDNHARELLSVEPSPRAHRPASPEGPWTGFKTFMADRDLGTALQDTSARQKVAAHLLPALCLALLDDSPEVRITAAYRLMCLGPYAESALGALQDATRDADERVRRAAEIAHASVQNREPELPYFVF